MTSLFTPFPKNEIFSFNESNADWMADCIRFTHVPSIAAFSAGTFLEKAQGELEVARQIEQSDLNNFEMLEQSLTDEVKFAIKEMASA